jgi:hypothetical protein
MPTQHGTIFDAIRIRDNVPVMMKRVDRRRNPGEWELAEMLSSPSFADARNHCVPIYEILRVKTIVSL